MTTITLIAAYARNRVIGKDNRMPWHLPEDLAHFKRATLGAPIIMGRHTWESIGRALPGRRNMVVSRTPTLSLIGAEIFTSLDQAIRACEPAPEVFVIGGAQVYAQAISVAHRLVMTEIDATFDGDTFFPKFDQHEWQEISREGHQAQSPNDFFFSFVEYKRQVCFALPTA